MNALFSALVQASEEAEVNQLLASHTMVGAHGTRIYALPSDRLVSILKSRGAIARR